MIAKTAIRIWPLRPATREKKEVLRCVGKLATELGLEGEDWNSAVLEYRDVSAPLLASVATGQPLAAASNQRVWSQVLAKTFVVPSRIAPLRLLPGIVRFYLSIEDGECQVERDLGQVASIKKRGATSDQALNEDIFMIKAMGPQARCEIVDPATGGLTPTSKCWAEMWRTRHGARLGAGGGSG